MKTKNKKTITYGLIVVVVLVLLIVWGQGGFESSSTTTSEVDLSEEIILDDSEAAEEVLTPENLTLEDVVVEYELQGNEHVVNDKHEEYNSNPPSSGPHLAQAPGWGYYKRGLTDESSLHAVEHGGIWVSYKDISDEELEQLKDFQKDNSGSSILTPREENDSRIVLVSWGKVMNLNVIDIELMQEFLDVNKNKTHEPFAL
jgi:hypothetical protein